MSAEAKTICYQYKLFLTQNIIFSKDKIVIKILFVLLQVSRKHGSDIAWRMRIPNNERNRNHRPNSPRLLHVNMGRQLHHPDHHNRRHRHRLGNQLPHYFHP